MATLDEKTGVRLSIATLIAFGVTVAGAVKYQSDWEAEQELQTSFAKTTAEHALTVAEGAAKGVEDLSLVVRVSNIRRDIKDLQAELRALRRELEEHPDSILIKDQIDDVERELTELENILRCYRTVDDTDRCEEFNL